MKHSSLNLNKFSDYIREHGIDAAMAKYHMSRNTVKKICKNNDIPHTHTHTELHEMTATPSFHFRSVL